MIEKIKRTLAIIFIVCGFTIGLAILDKKIENISIITSSNTLSNEKIGWGISRKKNHVQPDLGKKNLELIDKNEDIAIGKSEKSYIYLTFDEGYEAGYTSKILDVLKENNVKAAFFITGHYLNSQEDLVKRMINEGHIVGNQLPPSQMY